MKLLRCKGVDLDGEEATLVLTAFVNCTSSIRGRSMAMCGIKSPWKLLRLATFRLGGGVEVGQAPYGFNQTRNFELGGESKTSDLWA